MILFIFHFEVQKLENTKSNQFFEMREKKKPERTDRFSISEANQFSIE